MRSVSPFRVFANLPILGVMDGEAVIDAFEKRNGMDHAVGRKMYDAAVANKSMHARYKFREAQPKGFQVQVREAIDPLFGDIVLV